MNRRDFLGNIKNYNGKNRWSVEAVQTRYRDYCRALALEPSRTLQPFEHRQGDIVWIYPVMDNVIDGIVEGDAGCIALGVDFVEEAALFPFGPRLKSNTARALRRAVLTEEQKARLRARVSVMLIMGIVPHEMREYAKLLRTIGVAEWWPRLERHIPRDNPYAMRFFNGLRESLKL